MASHTLESNPSQFEAMKNPTLVASIEALKVVEGKEVALELVVLASLSGQVMLHFSIGSFIYSFIGPLLDSEEAKQASFFPYLKNRDILISQERMHYKYLASFARLFGNNPKNIEEYIKWLDKSSL